MSWLSVALLACAVIAVVGAEWPRLVKNLGFEERRRREREQRKSQFRLLRTERPEHDDESDEFAASVERDLSRLPTIDERDL